MTAQINIPAEAVSLARNATEIAKSCVIDSSEMAEVASDDLKELARIKKKVTDTRLSITRPMDAAKKAAMDAFKPLLDRIEAADVELRGKLNIWMRQQEELRRKREQELADEAEARRKELEDKIEAAREAGDEEALQAAEDDALLHDLSVPTVAEPQKLSGISQATSWKVEDIDLHALVKAAAADPDLLVYLQADTVEINKVVRALRDRHRIPGVTAKADTSIRVRS